MVDLAKAKKYLRIDNDFVDDDDYIQMIISSAYSQIDFLAGDRYKNSKNITNEGIQNTADILCLKFIEDMYNNKSSYVDSNLKRDIFVTNCICQLSMCEEVDVT